MASSSSSSSHFEELPSSPTSSTHSFHSTDDFDQSAPAPAPASSSTTTTRAQPNPSTPTATKPTTSRGEASKRAENDAEDEDDPDHDDSVWWTPSELRASWPRLASSFLADMGDGGIIASAADQTNRTPSTQDILDRSVTFKTRGNTLFRKGDWQDALDCYREGLVELPVRTKPGVKIVKGKQKEEQDDFESTKNILDGVDKLNLGEEPSNEAEQESDPEEVELVELRSVLFANVAACCLKLERWKEAVEACDEGKISRTALEEKPKYMKALHRRALANEQLGTWSSLTSALEDYTALSTLPDFSPSFKQQIKSAQARLTPSAKAQQEKEQAEMMGKLKDLGNTVLGKFGLSTENFKFVEQPGGGYSMNFQR